MVFLFLRWGLLLSLYKFACFNIKFIDIFFLTVINTELFFFSLCFWLLRLDLQSIMQKFRQIRNTCVSWSFVSSFIYHSVKYSQTLKRMLACNIIMPSEHSSSLQKRPLSKNRETLILNFSYHLTLHSLPLTFFSILKVLNNWIVAYHFFF